LFTKEILSSSSLAKHSPLAIPALVSALSLFLPEWLWYSLYFQIHNIGDISVVIGFTAIFVAACLALMRLTLGLTNTHKLINFSMALLLTFLSFKYFRKLGWIPELSTLQKIFPVCIALMVGLLTLKIRLDVCKRLYLSVIVGSLIFIFFPILLAYSMAPTIYWPNKSDQSPNTKAPLIPIQNTVIILLDELSYSAAGPVASQLKDVELNVLFTGIESVGKNTINVIPAIWSRSNFDQSTPCGPTQLCSGSKVLDFSKVYASSDNIDIVGFYHRYCSIQGIRYCSFAPLPERSIGIDFICIFPGIKNLVHCDKLFNAERQSWIALRENMQKSLLEAPFWQNGGILFAHLFVPHPLMGVPLKPLQDEYRENIEDGAKLVKIVALKAKQVFGDDFTIVVFSDHPLRAESWCAKDHYKLFGCSPTSEQISTQVPLIIATPFGENKSIHKINSNQNIFDLLY
jgi:hypothetical protein